MTLGNTDSLVTLVPASKFWKAADRTIAYFICVLPIWDVSVFPPGTAMYHEVIEGTMGLIVSQDRLPRLGSLAGTRGIFHKGTRCKC